MILVDGQELVLGGVTYPAVRFLGAGAIAEVYGSRLNGHEVAIKLLGSEPQSGTRFEPDSKEAAQLRHEADVLWQLNAAEIKKFADLNVALKREHSAYGTDASQVRQVLLERLELANSTARDRVIVALLDQGLDDTGRPWLVEELAPPAIEMKAVQGPADELRILEVMWRVAIGMALAHANRYALNPDFSLDTKADRIRVRWHGDTPEVRLIDWNITGGPELFAKDLTYFGGHFYQLLLGRRLELNGEDRPLHALGLGSPVWNTLSAGCRGILERLLHPDPRRRYTTAAELQDDLGWLVEVYKLAHPVVQSGKLRERAVGILPQRRYDRLAAVCDLALRGQLSEDDSRAFLTLQEEARRGLAQVSPALSKIKITLGAGSYRYAALDAERELEYLDPRSDQARQLRYIRLLAQVGQAMRDQGILNPSQAREWSALERGIQYLNDWMPVEAEEQFRSVAAALPALAGEGPLQALLNLARAYQYFAQANELAARAEPRPEDARRPDWLEVEKTQLDLLRRAIALLEDARQLATAEPSISDAWRFRQTKLAQREIQFEMMERAEKALAREDYEGAELALREVLAQNPQHARAQYLLAPAEQRARFEAQLKEGQLLLSEGRYREAQTALIQAQARVQDDPRLRPALKQAEVGAAIQRRAELILKGCAELVRADVRRAREEVRAVTGWSGRGLHELAAELRLDVVPLEGEVLPAFVLEPGLARQLQGVQEQIVAAEVRLVDEALRDAEERWRQTRFSEAKHRLQEQADLAVGGQIEAVRALDKRLEECLRVESEMRQKVSTWSSQLAAPIDSMAVAAVTVTDSLAEYLTGIAENQNMPEIARTDARRLAAAVRSLSSQPDELPELTEIVQSSWLSDVQVVDLTRDLFAASLSVRAAGARENGRLEEVLALLKKKADIRSLSLEEEHWKSSAEAEVRRRKEVLEGQEKARRELEAAQKGIADDQREVEDVQERLRAALRELRANDTSEEANRIRKEVASTWRRLARAQTEPGRASEVARAGARALRPFDLAADLDADLALLEDVIRIDNQATQYFESRPVSWDAAPEQLPQLGAKLRTLQDAERSWPALQEWARQREQWVADRLAEQLDTVIAQARNQRRQSQFKEALESVAQGQRLLPEGVWRDRSDLQDKWKTLEAIRKTVEDRQAYEAVMEELKKGLLQPGTSAAAEKVESLEASPDDLDLQHRLTRLRELQRWAQSAFTELGPEKNYALTLSNGLNALRKMPEARVDSDDDLDKLVVQQKQRLETHINRLVENLAQALRDEVQQLVEGGKSDPSLLFSLYRQARRLWIELLEDTTVIADVKQHLEDSLRRVDTLPTLILTRTRELWARVIAGDRSAAEQAQALITNLISWRASLTQEPASVALPTESLSLQQRPKMETVSTDDDLRRLQKDLETLQEPASDLAGMTRRLEALKRVGESYRAVVGRGPNTF